MGGEKRTMHSSVEKDWNPSLVTSFLGITFGLMLLGWGSCAVLSQLLHWSVSNPILRVLFTVGGFSPTVASYLALKKHHAVGTVWDWLKQAFYVKCGVFSYGCVALFVAVYYLSGILINGCRIGAPVLLQVVIVPMMLFGGGNEEVGWRMILQPELEKKLGFHGAAWLTGLIWWIWHTPLFFIQGTANANMNFFLFGILCVALSYGLGAVGRISKGVFPCILTHCLINGLSATFVFPMSLIGCLVCLAVTAAAAAMLIVRTHKVCAPDENRASS